MMVLWLWPSFSFALVCENRPLPDIDIQRTSNRINYNFTLSKIALQNFDIDTRSPYDNKAHTEIGGLMNGEISIKTNVGFGWNTETRSKQTCYWYDAITVKMHIDPTIYIAKEHRRGGCMHKAILDHEMKHVEVDRDILKKYAKLIDTDLRKATAQVGVIGPVSKKQGEKTRNKMLEIIEKTVSKRADAMYLERRKRQQAIDSLEEYEHVAAQCK